MDQHMALQVLHIKYEEMRKKQLMPKARRKSREFYWHEALKWAATSQTPAYWVHKFSEDDGGDEVFDHPTGSDCAECLPLYFHTQPKIEKDVLDMLCDCVYWMRQMCPAIPPQKARYLDDLAHIEAFLSNLHDS